MMVQNQYKKLAFLSEDDKIIVILTDWSLSPVVVRIEASRLYELVVVGG